MIMKRIYLFAAAAALLAACSSNDLSTAQQPQQVEAAGDGSVGFDAYLERSVTRSGDNVSGTMTYNTTNRKLTDTGFGVFGYYTDNNTYEGLTIPNFMYNQELTYDGPVSGKWGYSPVMYWPNEYGSSAIADDNDKVSFFAYAPYVDVNVNNGKASDQTYGITQMSRNSATGDPYIKYIASFDYKKAVDLLWGVVPSTGNTWDIVSGATKQMAEGLPWLDVERPREAATQTDASQRIKFQFKHALAKLNVLVDYDADATTHDETHNIDMDKSRVYIRSISFTGFSMKGVLNLNNTMPNEPLWLAYDAESDLDATEVTTLNDGRKDGREGVGGATAPAEANQFLNPALIQTGAWTGDNWGVQRKPQNLFKFPYADEFNTYLKSGAPTTIDNNSDDAFKPATDKDASATFDLSDVDNQTALQGWPVMVIPNGEEMTVTITYDVETVDKNLATLLSDGATQGSSVQNVITKTITFQGNGNKSYMEAGKKYTVKLHLGLNSVKFDAKIDEWDAAPIVNGEGWLPSNVTTFQAPGNYNYTVLASATGNAAFSLTGFSGVEAVSAAAAGAPITTSTPSYTASNGKVTVDADKFAITANTTVLNVTTADAMKFTGTTSGKEVVLNLIQLAAQPVYASDGSKSTLTFSSQTGTFAFKDADGTAISGLGTWTGDTRNVQILSATRNGVEMTEVAESATPAGALQFNTSDDGKITIGTDAKSKEVFVFTVKAGDAAPVTITSVVP